MKIVFFGLGSIGSRHARLIKDNFNYKLFAYRTHLGQTENDLNIIEIDSEKEILKIKPDVAFITNPTFLHIQTALKLANLGINLFIEKPVSNSLTNVNKLLKVIKSKKILTYIGFCLRFHPVISELKKIIRSNKVMYSRIISSSYLPNWRPDQDYRKTFTANKKMGGGVLFEVMHEIDYSFWLFGKIEKITGQYGKISNLRINSEDFGELFLFHNTGIYSSIHLDYFSQNLERKIQIYCKDEYYEGDLINNNIKKINSQGIETIKKFSLNRDDIYLSQLKYFFKCIKNKIQPMNNLEEAKNPLEELIKFKNNNQFIRKRRK